MGSSAWKNFIEKSEYIYVLKAFQQEVVNETLQNNYSEILSSVENSITGFRVQDIIATIRQLVRADKDIIDDIFLDLNKEIKNLCDDLSEAAYLQGILHCGRIIENHNYFNKQEGLADRANPQKTNFKTTTRCHSTTLGKIFHE